MEEAAAMRGVVFPAVLAAPPFHDRLNRERLIRHYTQRLADLGVETAAAPVPVPKRGKLSEDPPLVSRKPGAVHLQLQIVEQSFDVQLDPVRAEIAVTVKILKEADLAPGSSGRVLWDAHVRQLQALAATLPPAALADLGLNAVPGQEKPAGG